MSKSQTCMLVLDKKGQIGWELQRSLAALGELITLDREGLADFDSLWCGDLADPADLARTVHLLKPQVIVNAAAYTAVDKAEFDVKLAHRLDADAPGLPAQAAYKEGAWLVHYSTDYIFNGCAHPPWQKADTAGRLNAYGLTELEGEPYILQTCRQYLIFGICWVYAARGAI